MASSAKERSPVAGMVLVGIGGALGTLLRYSLGSLLAGEFVVNVVGAFALGLLIARLAKPVWSAPRAAARADRLRLLLGTGVLGGFTTYSGLATTVALLAQQVAPWAALGYAAGTLIVGLIASLTGLWLGGWGRDGSGSARVTTEEAS